MSGLEMHYITDATNMDGAAAQVCLAAILEAGATQAMENFKPGEADHLRIYMTMEELLDNTKEKEKCRRLYYRNTQTEKYTEKLPGKFCMPSAPAKVILHGLLKAYCVEVEEYMVHQGGALATFSTAIVDLQKYRLAQNEKKPRKKAPLVVGPIYASNEALEGIRCELNLDDYSTKLVKLFGGKKGTTSDKKVTGTAKNTLKELMGVFCAFVYRLGFIIGCQQLEAPVPKTVSARQIMGALVLCNAMSRTPFVEPGVRDQNRNLLDDLQTYQASISAEKIEKTEKKKEGGIVDSEDEGPKEETKAKKEPKVVLLRDEKEIKKAKKWLEANTDAGAAARAEATGSSDLPAENDKQGKAADSDSEPPKTKTPKRSAAAAAAAGSEPEPAKSPAKPPKSPAKANGDAEAEKTDKAEKAEKPKKEGAKKKTIADAVDVEAVPEPASSPAKAGKANLKNPKNLDNFEDTGDEQAQPEPVARTQRGKKGKANVTEDVDAGYQ